jgi:glycine cleavage system transcriptional repressor
VVAPPEEGDMDRLGEDLDAVREQLDLEMLNLSPLVEADPSAEPAPTHIVTLYGADHPGIVHAATSALAQRSIDITDLTTKLVAEGADPPIYALMMEIAPPPGADAGELESALQGVAREQGVDLTLRQLDQEVL